MWPMKRIIVIAFCIVLLGLSGCGHDVTPVVSEETTYSVNATAPATEGTATALSEDPGITGVYSPATGSETYTDILESASVYLRAGDTLIAHQLKVEGDSAVADVEAQPQLTGWRTLLALTRTGDDWAVRFSADAFDGAPSLDATRFPGMSSSLLAALEWSRARTTLEELARTHALAEAATLGGFARDDLTTTSLRLARTTSHEWWASCVVENTGASMDAITIYMRWRQEGAGWETFDCGTGIEPAQDPRFPSDVAGQL